MERERMTIRRRSFPNLCRNGNFFGVPETGGCIAFEREILISAIKAIKTN
jgi:hypothetical protein